MTNSLLQAGFAEHGLLPVGLVLGQLLQRSRISFIWGPSLGLVEEDGENEEAAGDLDVVCIQDGKFVIGKVKQSVGLFSQSDVDKMLGCAQRLTPDRLIFSSLDRNPSSLVTRNVERLAQELAPIGTDVRWFQIGASVFGPLPP